MNINVLDNYKITSDKYQYILNEKDEDGSWRAVGYYSTLNGLLDGLINFDIKKREINDWKELSSELRKINKELETIRKQLEDKNLK